MAPPCITTVQYLPRTHRNVRGAYDAGTPDYYCHDVRFPGHPLIPFNERQGISLGGWLKMPYRGSDPNRE